MIIYKYIYNIHRRCGRGINIESWVVRGGRRDVQSGTLGVGFAALRYVRQFALIVFVRLSLGGGRGRHRRRCLRGCVFL